MSRMASGLIASAVSNTRSRSRLAMAFSTCRKVLTSDQVLDLQRAQMLLQLERLGDRGGQRLVGRPAGTAVAPLGEADHRVGGALTRQREVLQPVRERGAAGMSQVRHQEPDQQVLQARRLVLVAEVARHQLPERRLHAVLLHLLPGGREGIQIAVGDGVEQRDQDVEELRLIRLGEDRDDLAVDVQLVVSRADQLLQPLQPVPTGEELGSLGQVLAERLLGEPEVGRAASRPDRR